MADKYVLTQTAINEIRKCCQDCLHTKLKAPNECKEPCGINNAIRALKKLPSEDLTKVVRCKDCKYWHREYSDLGCELTIFSHCMKKRGGNGLDWYCSSGETE